MADPRANGAMKADEAVLAPGGQSLQTTAFRSKNISTLMRAAQAMCNDPALSLHYGETVDMSEVSIVGLIMNASETMADAFIQLQRFGRLALEVEGVSANTRFELAQRDDQLWMVDTRANPNDFPELTESTFTRLVCGPRRFLPRPHVWKST